MPMSEETEQMLRAAQEGMKRGNKPTFGKHAPPGMTGRPQAAPTVNTARELVDAEVLFGSQMVALEANIRALLATMRQLQQARMRYAVGTTDTDLADLDRVEHELTEKAKKVGIGPDGFITTQKE